MYNIPFFYHTWLNLQSTIINNLSTLYVNNEIAGFCQNDRLVINYA